MASKKQDSVQDAIDATKRFQDISDRRYKYNTSVLGFLTDYDQAHTYDKMVNEAKKDMRGKAAVAERDRAYGNVMGGVAGAMMAGMTEKEKKAYMEQLAREQRAKENIIRENRRRYGLQHGGAVKKYAKGGSVRGGGCEMRGKTKGKFV
jgi:hypothetical protein